MRNVENRPKTIYTRMSFLCNRLTLLIILILSAILSFPDHAQSQQNNKSLTPLTIQLRWFHQFQFAGYYAAKAQGYYQEAGLDVTILERDNNQDPITEVVEGRAQFGVTNSEVLVHALNGKPVTVLAAIFQHSPLALLVRADSDLMTPHDLIGRRVKMSRQMRDVELQAMFLNEGMNLDQLNLTDGAVENDDFLDPSLDARAVYITNQPYYLEQLGIDYNLILPRHYGIDFYGDCLFTSKEMVNNQHDEMYAFVLASLRGWEYAIEHQEEIIDLILTEYSNKKTRSHLEFEAAQLQKLILPRLVQIGNMSTGRWKHIADTFAHLGLAPRENISEAFFDEFMHGSVEHAKIVTLNKTVHILWIIILGVLTVVIALLLVTRRMKNEIKRRKTVEKALKKSEEFHRTLFENTGTCTVVAEKDGTITMANKQSETLFKVPRESFINKTKWQDTVFPDDLARMIEINQQRLQGKDVPTGYEFRFVTGEGDIRNVYVTVGILPNSNQIICSLNDLTPRIKAEQERKELIDVLEIKNEELERFAYTVSHDLKSPLITIKGFIGVLEEAIADQDSDLVRQSMQRITGASDTMLSLLDELLELSRIGRVGNTPVEASLTKLANEAADQIHGVLVQAKTSISVADDLPMALCDPMRIREVFQNMFENAAKYGSPHGDTRVEVSQRIEETEHGPKTVIVVQDNGIGIDPKYTERVFNLFEQLNPGPNSTGIGLALVKRIIEHHGGQVWAESKGLGHGTAFCFTLGTLKPYH